MPRTLAQIMAINTEEERKLLVPPDKPYHTDIPAEEIEGEGEGEGGGGGESGGESEDEGEGGGEDALPHRYVVDLPYTLQNAALLAMIYIYEGIEKPTVTDAQLDAARVAAEADGATEDDTDAHTFLKVVKDIEDKWVRYSDWFLLLVACTQVRKLDTGNLTQFCNMCDARQMPAKVLSLLRYFAANMPRLVESDQLRTAFSGYPYFEYHTSASSTPGLVDKALGEVRGLGLFSAEEERVVDQALVHVHDLELTREIDPNTLVKARAILEANGTLPEIWYMGQRAVGNFSGKKYTAMVKLFKELFNRQSRTDDLDELDEPALVERLSALIMTIDINDRDVDDNSIDGDEDL